MTRASLTTTRTGRPRASVDPKAVAAEVEHLKADVGDIKRALAPAFARPKEKTVDGPRQANGSTGTSISWHNYPDHDPDYIAGRISLSEAERRHHRPDDGCPCVNCRYDRKVADACRPPVSEPVPQARCPICLGSGFRGRPEAMGWSSCKACGAEEFFKLHAEAYQGGSYTTPTQALKAARERVENCTECHGEGRIWEVVPVSPCPACKGSGLDDHIVTPGGTLWRKASSGEYARDTSGGRGVEQVTLTYQAEPTGLPPVAETTPWASEPAAEAGAPPWAIARATGQAITRPRGY